MLAWLEKHQISVYYSLYSLLLLLCHRGNISDVCVSYLYFCAPLDCYNDTFSVIILLCCHPHTGFVSVFIWIRLKRSKMHQLWMSLERIPTGMLDASVKHSLHIWQKSFIITIKLFIKDASWTVHAINHTNSNDSDQEFDNDRFDLVKSCVSYETRNGARNRK